MSAGRHGGSWVSGSSRYWRSCGEYCVKYRKYYCSTTTTTAAVLLQYYTVKCQSLFFNLHLDLKLQKQKQNAMLSNKKEEVKYKDLKMKEKWDDRNSVWTLNCQRTAITESNICVRLISSYFTFCFMLVRSGTLKKFVCVVFVFRGRKESEELQVFQEKWVSTCLCFICCFSSDE